MLLRLPNVLSRSNCILILIMSNLANAAPLKSRKRLSSESEQGFSGSPRILEIQLPLKITSKEDLLAWSKYVMSLVTSKVNFTSFGLKDSSSVGTQHEKQISSASNPASRLKEMKKGYSDDKQQGLNYPARRLKTPPKPDDKIVAYPLPIGGIKKMMAKPPDPFAAASISRPIDQHLQFGQYASFSNDNVFRQGHTNGFSNIDISPQQPAITYLPLPMRNDVLYQNTVNKNVPSKLEETLAKPPSDSNLRIKAFNDEFGQISATNNGLTKKNQSHVGEPLLAFPFQAVITITRQLPADAATSKTQSNEYFAVGPRNPPDEFPPYFERNYTVTNKPGQISVIFNDVITDTSKKKLREKEEIVKDEAEREEHGSRSKGEKKVKGGKKQKSRRRQSSTFGDLLRTLGVLRRPPKNTTEISVATPVVSILKGTNPQKIQVAFEELPNQERRNETLMSEAQVNSDEEEEDEEEEEEEGEGGSIQALIELLPLAAPILEDLSDPESDVNIVEVIQGAIPLLEGLSDPNEEGGIDIPGVLIPLSQKLSDGPDGQSDSAAILGPLIQVIAPLIGPLVGPLIGPLSRTISGTGGKDGSASLITALAAPLSEPQGPYGHSVLSNLIAGITAGLSKELAASASDSDVKSLVSTLVSGVLVGTSSGSSGKGTHTPYGQNDTYYAPTTYGDYNSYYKPQVHQTSSTSIKDTINDAIQQILGSFLKLSATSSTSGANLSASMSSSSTSLSAGSSDGSSDSSKPPAPTYNAPATPPYPHSPRPTYYTSTNSPYAALFARRQVKPIKKF